MSARREALTATLWRAADMTRSFHAIVSAGTEHSMTVDRMRDVATELAAAADELSRLIAAKTAEAAGDGETGGAL